MPRLGCSTCTQVVTGSTATYFLTQEMLAMALLMPGGHLGGLGGNARQVGGSGEGVLTPPTAPDGLRWGVETGELAHLLPPCLFLAFARPASVAAERQGLGRSLVHDEHTGSC
eukprot:COSAG03_NODE_268_length_9661_cov_28.909433_4_plen_113_part_00